ncbi:MAG: hypothetical protein ACK587_15820 [Cyanobacteriota bacterium]
MGRPILVSQDFHFTLEQLIGVSAKAPRRVVGGRREFMPCVCLAPEPAGPNGGGAALPSGPFLLVIEAGELPEGKAKVTGDVCGGRRGEPCAADAWRGSFGLSLVHFPVDAPLLKAIPDGDPWALRGTLSAYYFDVFEHPLWSRWDPPFPLDGSFSGGSEPFRHEGMAIPLALVHLGEDGTALYIDSWIPRRLITATPGEDWHRTRFGAPPRAAAWARIHQFQAMLQESLARQPMADLEPGEANLYGRGFRHLPPIGFLPVVEQNPASGKSTEKPTYCTDFSKIMDKSIANPYEGIRMKFDVRQIPGNSQDPSLISAISGFQGLALDGSAGNATCSILLGEEGSQALITLLASSQQSTRSPISVTMISGYDGDPIGNPIVTKTLTRIDVGQTIEISARDKPIKSVVISTTGFVILGKFCYKPAASSVSVKAQLSRNAMAREALHQARAYFEGTNVIPYGVVALHDDDILEDLQTVIDKDPLQLQIPQKEADRFSDREKTSRGERVSRKRQPILLQRTLTAISSLAKALRSKGLTIDALVNRHVEVVKLVVPLQGLSRQHPLLDGMEMAADKQATAWGLQPPSNQEAAILGGAKTNPEQDCIPRGHVVYVKQRVVLLHFIFLLWEQALGRQYRKLQDTLVPPINFLLRSIGIKRTRRG